MTLRVIRGRFRLIKGSGKINLRVWGIILLSRCLFCRHLAIGIANRRLNINITKIKYKNIQFFSIKIFINEVEDFIWFLYLDCFNIYL